MGAPILAAVLCLMLNGLVYWEKDNLSHYKTSTKGKAVYPTSNEFDHWLDGAIAQYVNLYRLFYPTVFALCALRFSISEFATEQLMAMELLTANAQPESIVLSLP